MAIGKFSLSYLLFCALHFAQFVMAVTVCGLYGYELNRAAKAGKHADGKWVCARHRSEDADGRMLTVSTGLRRGDRRPFGADVASLLSPLHSALCVGVGMEPHPLHPVDRPVWHFWKGESTSATAGVL